MTSGSSKAFLIAATLALVQSGATAASICPGVCASSASPVLSTPDFDGSGTVDTKDVKLLEDFLASGKGYTAFYDVNADGKLDQADVTRVKAVASGVNPSRSTPLDRSLVSVFKSTEHLLQQDSARDDLFLRMSQDAAGRGAEFMRSPIEIRDGYHPGSYEGHMDASFNIHKPDGLLYDTATNRLLAAEYVATPDESQKPVGSNFIRTWPEAFELGMPLGRLTNAENVAKYSTFFESESATWTPRLGVCMSGFGLKSSYNNQMSSQMKQIPFSTIQECTKETTDAGLRELVLFPSFSSLTVWVHSLNRCGVFSVCNPDVAGSSGAAAVPLGKTPGKLEMCSYLTRQKLELLQLAGFKEAPTDGLASASAVLALIETELDNSC